MCKRLNINLILNYFNTATIVPGSQVYEEEI